MLGQLGLQPPLQASLDQLLDQPVLALELDLPGIDLRYQLIQGAGRLQGIHASGRGGPAGKLLRQHITGFSHSHNDSPINQRLHLSYTNNLTPPGSTPGSWSTKPASLDPAGAAGAGGALPGPRRPGPGPGLPGRGARSVPVPRQGPHLARTPPPGQHRGTPHHDAPRTGGSSTPRTGTAWPGSPPTSRPTPPRGSGTGPPPPPAPSRARTRPGPSPSSAPTSPPPGSSPPDRDGGTAADRPAGTVRRNRGAGTGTGGITGGGDGGAGAERWAGRGCAVAAGAGPGHRPGAVPARRHRRTGHAGRVRADPAVDGPPPDRRRRRLLPPGPDRPPRRRAAGNRPDQLPAHEGPCANGSGSATASAPSPAAATTPWTTRQTTSWPGPTAAPPASPTWASPAANTTASNTAPPGPPPAPAKTTRRAGPHPSGRHYPSEHQDWEPPHWPNQGIPPDPGRDHDLELPQDPFPEWHLFTAAHPLPAADTGDPGWPATLDDTYP